MASGLYGCCQMKNRSFGPEFKILCCVFAPQSLPDPWHLEGAQNTATEGKMSETYVTVPGGKHNSREGRERRWWGLSRSDSFHSLL